MLILEWYGSVKNEQMANSYFCFDVLSGIVVCKSLVIIESEILYGPFSYCLFSCVNSVAYVKSIFFSYILKYL